MATTQDLIVVTGGSGFIGRAFIAAAFGSSGLHALHSCLALTLAGSPLEVKVLAED